MKKYICMVICTATLLGGCKKNESEWDATGIFEATEVTLSAKTQGEVVMMGCEEGDAIGMGDCLALVDTTMLSLQRQALVANLSATDARRLNEKTQLATLKKQKENLKAERERFGRLLERGAATQKQVDDMDQQLEVLDKQIKATEEQINATNRSLSGQASAIEAQVMQIDKQIGDCHICSPIAGIVTGKYMEQGEYAAPGKPMVRVADLTNIRLRAYIDAPQLTTMKIGQKVTVYADLGSDEQKAYEGTLTWISDKAEFTPKTIQTRDERANLVYAIKINVVNDGLIKLGMYGNLRFDQ